MKLIEYILELYVFIRSVVAPKSIKAKDLHIPFSQAGVIVLLIIQLCPKNYITSNFQCFLLLLLLLFLLHLLLQLYSSLSLAFTAFLTDALSVLSKLLFSIFYTHISQVQFNITFICVFFLFSLLQVCFPLMYLLPFTSPSHNTQIYVF